jgi:hypothetical protein
MTAFHPTRSFPACIASRRSISATTSSIDHNRSQTPAAKIMHYPLGRVVDRRRGAGILLSQMRELLGIEYLHSEILDTVSEIAAYLD